MTGAKENQDFEMYQGEGVTLTWAIVDGNDDPLDMSTFTRSLTISFRRTDPVADEIFSAALSLVNVNGTNDGLQITLAQADTQSVKPGLWWYEVEATDSNGDRGVLATGRVKLKGSLGSA